MGVVVETGYWGAGIEEGDELEESVAVGGEVDVVAVDAAVRGEEGYEVRMGEGWVGYEWIVDRG